MFGKSKKNLSMSITKLRSLDRRGIKYSTERDSESYNEKHVGENGAINLENNEFLLISGGKNVIRCDIEKVRVSELMNLSGIVIKGFDKDSGRERTIIAYFSDGAVGVNNARS